MTYAMEFRRVVAAAYDECGSSADVAEQFGCSESWVRRLIRNPSDFRARYGAC
jgi:transposase-like protein